MTENDKKTRGRGNSGKFAAGFSAASERHEPIDSGESTASDKKLKTGFSSRRMPGRIENPSYSQIRHLEAIRRR